MKVTTSKDDSQTDWERLEKTPDGKVNLSDMPELDAEFFQNAKVRMPRKKAAVSIRLDQDVLAWFKEQGRGYQTRMNAILRAYVEAHTQP
jgi:uncharacterized protein (DUF4415 family)